ncbi:MAG TPA: NAD-dependent epimerase/dehydratase family protein [Streptosporangiaceae bacterium]|jgi:2'-hydroxyisoflavone reductase|nr:NAD-dependent epimerase/dehydratase family protein [Streptosporangiaceae bacterium]
MRILVLGGTGFVGRAIVDQAVSRGHDVTTFTRGQHGEPRPGAQSLHGDRTRPGDLTALSARDWDAVIDTSTIAPAHVNASARLLAGHAGHYTYVSSLSVYTGRPREPVTEESPVFGCPPTAEGSQETLGYGPLKAGSERAVADAFPGRHLIVRPGVIAGPHDDVGRLPWWLARLAQGGRVLAPGRPDRPVRLTDARDLAAWLVDSIRRKIAGVVNVPGPLGCTFGDLLTACLDAVSARAEAPAELVWTPDDVLLAAGVEPYTELPLWVPDIPDLAGTWAASGDRAQLAGMRYRPLASTVRDTWGWLCSESAAKAKPAGELAHRAGIGLDLARERKILAGL